jgi:hypothetical protein
VRVEIRVADAYGEDDPSWTHRPESERALRAAKAVFA